jgi:hypothetical protein
MLQLFVVMTCKWSVYSLIHTLPIVTPKYVANLCRKWDWIDQLLDCVVTVSYHGNGSGINDIMPAG